MAGSSTLGLGVRTQGEGWPEVTDRCLLLPLKQWLKRFHGDQHHRNEERRQKGLRFQVERKQTWTVPGNNVGPKDKIPTALCLAQPAGSQCPIPGPPCSQGSWAESGPHMNSPRQEASI